MGAEINAQVADQAFDFLDAPPRRLGGPFSPVPYSPPLEQEWLINSDDIVEAALGVVNG